MADSFIYYDESEDELAGAGASAFLTLVGLDTDLLTFSLPASTTISAFGATIVDDANAAAVIATLGLDADLATFALPASTTIAAEASGFSLTANSIELHCEAATHVNQDLTSDASPTFATVKLSGLTDDYIPYHVDDSTGLANGPTKTNVDSAVSLKHTQNTDTGTTGVTFTINSGAGTTLVLTGGANTFSIADGTASLDIAAAAALNIDKSLTVDGFGTTITGAGQANTITLNESLTIGDGYNVTLTAEDAAGSIVLDEQTFEVEGEGTATRLFKLVNAEDAARTLTFYENLTIGDGNAGTITFSAASKTITVEDNATVSQDLSSDAGPTFEHVHLTNILFAAAAELTLVTGAVTRTQMIHTIDTEDGDPTDDLVTINGGADGLLLLIRADNAARTIVVKETGNIQCGGSDITLDDTNKYVLLAYDNALTKWLVVGVGGGSGSVATDAIWDANGDLAVGSGANTAARLAIGDAGQVLTVAGGTAVWDDPAAGTDVATDAIWDAKGDLAVGTGANTAAKLTVGADGKYLKAASGEATGLIWDTPSGGGATWLEVQVFS